MPVRRRVIGVEMMSPTKPATGAYSGRMGMKEMLVIEKEFRDTSTLCMATHPKSEPMAANESFKRELTHGTRSAGLFAYE
jgi:hypothetical protein